MACDDALKATAIIKHKGKEIKVESKYVGMTFTIESSYDTQGENVTCEYKLTNYAPDGTTSIEIFRINPNKNVYVQTPDQGGQDFGFPAFVLWADEDRLSAKYQGIQVINMTVAFGGNCLGNGYVVEIFDKRGRIFKKFFPGDQPEVQILCDDECPPGQQKCKHNGYPGYCCIPCEKVAARINSLAARIE